MGDADDVQMLPTCSQSSVCPFRYNHVDSDWQQRTCSAFRLKYIGPNGITPGGPEVCMTKPLSSMVMETASSDLSLSSSQEMKNSTWPYARHMRSIESLVHIFFV